MGGGWGEGFDCWGESLRDGVGGREGRAHIG